MLVLEAKAAYQYETGIILPEILMLLHHVVG